MIAILLLLLPTCEVERQEHDMLHRNHYYDATGEHVFTQVGGLDWCWQTEGFRWQWYTLRDVSIDRQRGVTVARWTDHGLRREVRAQMFAESWTTWDPELHDRQILPRGERMGLMGAD